MAKELIHNYYHKTEILTAELCPPFNLKHLNIMQTKIQSIKEAVTNTAVGFMISYISTFIIFPIVNVSSSPGKNIIITLYFTIISLIRSYVIRRWFNNKTPKPQNK